MNTEKSPPSTRYSLNTGSNDTQLRLAGIVLLATGFVAFAITFGVSGETLGGVLAIAAFLLAFAGIMVLFYRMSTRGSIDFTVNGLVIRRQGAREIYDWRDIESMELDNVPDRWVSGNRIPPGVQVRLLLSRSIRLGLISGRGTRTLGIPTGQRHTLIRVDDPQGFIAAAKEYREAALVTTKAISSRGAKLAP